MKQESVDSKRVGEIYHCIYQNIVEEYQLDLAFLKYQIEYLTTLLEYKLEEEPFKIRKKKHQEWRDEVEGLEARLAICYIEYNHYLIKLKK